MFLSALVKLPCHVTAAEGAERSRTVVKRYPEVTRGVPFLVELPIRREPRFPVDGSDRPVFGDRRRGAICAGPRASRSESGGSRPFDPAGSVHGTGEGQTLVVGEVGCQDDREG